MLFHEEDFEKVVEFTESDEEGGSSLDGDIRAKF
jgi:hypothetical protein